MPDAGSFPKDINVRLLFGLPPQPRSHANEPLPSSDLIIEIMFLQTLIEFIIIMAIIVEMD